MNGKRILNGLGLMGVGALFVVVIGLGLRVCDTYVSRHHQKKPEQQLPQEAPEDQPAQEDPDADRYEKDWVASLFIFVTNKVIKKQEKPAI